jgi:hypothetical protein
MEFLLQRNAINNMRTEGRGVKVIEFDPHSTASYIHRSKAMMTARQGPEPRFELNKVPSQALQGPY